MLLQSCYLRRDAAWRHGFAASFCLAVVSFVALRVYLLCRDVPRGLVQKAVIAAILLWLFLASWWLRRGPVGSRALTARGRGGVRESAVVPVELDCAGMQRHEHRGRRPGALGVAHQ
jgi:hypothetical protein